MRDDRPLPTERGELIRQGRCQVCGREGPVVAVLDAPPPNEFCEACAVEFGEVMLPPSAEDAP